MNNFRPTSTELEVMLMFRYLDQLNMKSKLIKFRKNKLSRSHVHVESCLCGTTLPKNSTIVPLFPWFPGQRMTLCIINIQKVFLFINILCISVLNLSTPGTVIW